MVRNILVVDNDREVRGLLMETFSTNGYHVIEAENGDDAVRMLETESFDLVILDIVIPGLSGFQVLRQFRKTSNVPVIILSARVDTIDKVETFELGADDYVTKPFVMAELTARVTALLRRTGTNARIGRKPGFDDGRLLIDFNRHQVFINGEDTELTNKEYDLLRELVVNAGNVLDFQRLLEDVWGLEYGEKTTRVKALVRKLRCKIEANPDKPQYVLTVKGVGYRFKKDL